MTVRNCTLGDVHCLNHVFKSNPIKPFNKNITKNTRSKSKKNLTCSYENGDNSSYRKVTITAGFPQV